MDRGCRAETFETGRIGFDAGSNVSTRIWTADHDHGHGASSYSAWRTNTVEPNTFRRSRNKFRLAGAHLTKFGPWLILLACRRTVSSQPVPSGTSGICSELGVGRFSKSSLGRRPGGNLRPDELIQTAIAASEDLQLGTRLLQAQFQPSNSHRSLTGLAFRAIGRDWFAHGHEKLGSVPIRLNLGSYTP